MGEGRFCKAPLSHYSRSGGVGGEGLKNKYGDHIMSQSNELSFTARNITDRIVAEKFDDEAKEEWLFRNSRGT